jgi:hypothetical protein
MWRARTWAIVLPERGRIDAVWRDPGVYAVALFTVAYCAPLFRLVNWLGDEGLLLHGAMRMFEGQVPYRDFFAIYPPGLFFIVGGWLTVFGTTFASARALAVATLAIVGVLVYTAARLTSGRRTIALALGLACVVRMPIDANHHWFATAASMASAVALLIAVAVDRPALGASFVAGLFAGAAGMILQTRGAYLAAAVLAALLLSPHGWRRGGVALGGLAVVPAASLGYLLAAGTVREAAADIVLFPLRHYSAIQYVPYGASTRWADYGVVVFFPLTLAVALAAAAFGWWRRPQFRAALALAAAGFAGAYPRPDHWHLAFVMPLGTPMLALGVGAILDRLRGARKALVIAALIAAIVWHVGHAAAERAVTATRAPMDRIMTVRGRIDSYPRQWTTDLRWVIGEIARRTSTEDRVFFYPYMPMLPYLTGRRQVGPIDIIVPGYTTPAQYREVCMDVTAAARWVVVERQWIRPRHLKLTFPAMAEPNPPERRAFERMLDDGFEPVAATENFELRQRTARAIPALCTAITARAGAAR